MPTMFDSTTPGSIPKNAEIVAGYVGGAWPTYGSLAGLFPGAIHVSIAANATEVAEVLDVETGDATPAEVPAWLEKVRATGIDPTIYCNLSTWPEVRLQCQRENVPEPHYWIADPTGVDHVVPGSVATQWAWPAHGSPGHYDISTTIAGWPTEVHAPAPPPVSPVPTSSPSGGDVTLPTIQLGAHGGYVKSLQALLVEKAGQHIGVDGAFGPATRAAVLNVQRFFRLSPDGVVGPTTWSALLAL